MLADLRGAVDGKLQEIEEQWIENHVDPTSKKFIERNFLILIEKLKAQGKLPALVFRLAAFPNSKLLIHEFIYILI